MNSLINVCGTDIRVHGNLLRFAHVDGEKFVFMADPEPVLQGLRKCGVRIDLFTFMPRLGDQSARYSFPMEMDNLAAIPISIFDHWWTKQIDGKTRNMIRKAEKKGVVVREVPFDDDLVKGIWEVYNESAVRQGTRNTHYGKDLDTVYREEATFLDKSIFIGAFLDDSLIGFIKLVVDDTRTQAGTLNIVSMIRHRDKAPTNALVAQAVRSCADRGIPYLTYSNFAYGKKQHDSLSDFKERNGFQRIDVPRYYVPLTAAGRIAYSLGLHHGLVDRLPASVAAKLRGLRAAWYKRKLPSAAEPVPE
jgi:hypothetical protein